MTTLVEIYRHVGERFRVDISKKDINTAKYVVSMIAVCIVSTLSRESSARLLYVLCRHCRASRQHDCCMSCVDTVVRVVSTTAVRLVSTLSRESSARMLYVLCQF